MLKIWGIGLKCFLNFVVLLFFSLCKQLAHQYWKKLRPPSLCQSNNQQILQSDPKNLQSMINYNFDSSLIELGLGISCCPKPNEGKDLSSVWNRIQPAMTNLINSLQGIHISVSNFDGQSGAVIIQELSDLKLRLDDRGHLWYLMNNGTFTITVEVEGYVPMTKMVRVLTSEFTEINFALPYSSGLPRAIGVLILSSVIVSIMLCTLLIHCRQQNKSTRYVVREVIFYLVSLVCEYFLHFLMTFQSKVVCILYVSGS